MKKILINFCAFCLLIPLVNVKAQNNLAVIDSIVKEVSTEIEINTKNEINSNIILDIAHLEKNIDGYLQTKIGNIFTKKNYQVFRNFPKDTSFESTILQIRFCNIIINYSEPYSKNLFTDSYVERTINFRIEGQIFNQFENRILFPFQIQKQYADEIKYKNIKNMEESPYLFTAGEKAGITVWQEYLEPTIVASSVIVVLLLLFTQRS